VSESRSRREATGARRDLRIAVLGVGLIGGSIGLAARRRLGAHVLGFDPDPGALAKALELGAIDGAAENVAEAVRAADYAFLAAPVGATIPLARDALAGAGADCVLSDVGSTKRRIARELADPRFVPGHPLAGAETSGVQGAREELFDDAVWYLTPSATVQSAAVARLSGLIEQLGAEPVAIDAEAHDRLMAGVSHLPHVLANVLVAQALRSAPALAGAVPGMLGANPSFRDATRVAGANTSVWTDIYLSNADLLAEALDEAIRELSGVRDALDAEDAEALAAWNDAARAARERLSGARAAGERAGAAPAAPSEGS
jgi:prephenate dehydrogenase